MAIDLKITTSAAEASLTQVKASIEDLRQKLNTLGNTKSLQKLATQLQSMQGLNPALATSINQLQQAVASLNQTASTTGAIANLGTQVATLTRQLSTVQPAASNAANGIANAGNAAQRANSQFQQAHAAISRITSVMAAFGLSLSMSAFSGFISDALEALQTVQKFDVQMKTLGGPQLAASQMEFLRATAKETGTSLETLVGQYGKFAQSAIYSGRSTQDVAANFYKLAATFRVLGLSADETKRAFNAFEQIFSKGKIQLQELRGQLGNAGIPAFSMLSIAIGKSTTELEKMASKGQLGTDALQKLIDKMFDMNKGGLAEALKSVGAVLANWETQFFNIKSIFAEDFFATFRGGLISLTNAMSNLNIRNVVRQIGDFTGFLGGAALYAIESFMTALIPISQWLTILGNGFSIVGNYIYGFGAAAVKATLDFFGLSALIGQSSQLLDSLAFAAKLVAGAFIGWAVIMTVIWAVNTTLTLFAGLMALLSSRAALMALSIGLTIAALWGLTAVAFAVTDALGATTGAYDRLVGKSQEAVKSALDLAKSMPGVTVETAKQSSALVDAAKSHEKFTSATSGSINAQTSGLPIWGYTTDAVSRYKQETDRAYEAGQRQVDAIIAARGGMGQYALAADGAASSNNSLANSFDGLASSASSAANAIQAVQMSKTTSGGSGGGGNYAQGSGDLTNPDVSWRNGFNPSGHIWDNWDIGGIPGVHSARTQSFVHASAWSSAPHYADGTPNTTGNGIPAVLHPNEAVIPLSGGRSIPVDMRGAGGGDLSGLMTRNVVETIAVRQSVDVLTATTNLNGVTAHTDVDRIIREMQSMQNLLNAMRSGSSSSGSSSGGSSTGGSTGSSTTKDNLDLGSYDQVKEIYGRGYADNLFRSMKVAKNPFLANVPDPYGNDTPIQMGPDGKLGKYSVPGAANGSPNLSRDTSGGFLALIHPDEAVIPLPDGRSVPVSMPEGRGDGGKQGNNIVINFNVTATDADSFRRSQDQMMQDLRKKIDRATANIGAPPAIEDPTKRA